MLSLFIESILRYLTALHEQQMQLLSAKWQQDLSFQKREFAAEKGVILYRKGNLAVFESSSISKTGETTPTKIGVHACYINAYLHEFFEPIPIH